jgi:hypothetical protein
MLHIYLFNYHETNNALNHNKQHTIEVIQQYKNQK